MSGPGATLHNEETFNTTDQEELNNITAIRIFEWAGGIMPDIPGATQQNYGEASSGLYSDSHGFNECAAYYSQV